MSAERSCTTAFGPSGPRTWRPALMFVFGLLLLAPASAARAKTNGLDIVSAVENCRTKQDLRNLIAAVRGTHADADLACQLAAHLQGGARWFDRGGVHADPIDGITCVGSTVYMLYHRDGRRWGYAEMTAHNINGLAVLVGDWYQASKMRGKTASTPPVPLPNGYVLPPIPIPYGAFFSDDHGGIVYVFQPTWEGFRPLSGVGIDFGDKYTVPNWLTGR